MNKYLLILTFLLLAACNKSETVFEKLPTDAVILAFGDSLTSGTGASKGADYPSVLSAITSRTVINAGLAGEISENGLARLPGLLDQHKPDLLILIHGGNDMLQRIASQQTSANLKKMISEANQRNIKVIMLGVPQPKLFLLSSAEFYQQVSEENQTPTDFQTLPKILSNNNLKSDTIHPNDEGYKILANNIFNFLVNTGAL